MTIEEIRRLREEGAFERDIVSRTPKTALRDIVALSCGHEMDLSPDLIYVTQSLHSGKIECFYCIKEAEKQV